MVTLVQFPHSYIVTRHDISPSTLEDTELVEKLVPMNDYISNILKERILYSEIDLDGRATILRKKETNLGNLIADTFKAYLNVDIALVNAGAIRCDRIIPEGELALTDLIDIMPFQNPIYVKRASGKVIRGALENGFSDMKYDGRYLQVSGLRMDVSKSASDGNRIQNLKNDSGVDIDDDAMYSFCVSSFITFGGDGFTMLKDLDSIPKGSEGVSETDIMLAVFTKMENTDDPNALRARRRVIKEIRNGLPAVNPSIDGRITLLN